MKTNVVSSAVSIASYFNWCSAVAEKLSSSKQCKIIAADSEIIFSYLIRSGPVVFLIQIPFATLCNRWSVAQTAISLSTLTERTRDITSAYLPYVTCASILKNFVSKKRSVSTSTKVFQAHWSNRCSVKLF